MSTKHYYEKEKNEIVENEHVESADAVLKENEYSCENKDTFGVVDGCKRLNIRKEPDKGSVPLCIVDCGTQLMIDPKKSIDDWYHVYNSSGLDGYCMKQYIKIKR